MHDTKDITGQRFGNLTALRLSDQRYKGNLAWEWLCDCGKTVILPANRVMTGHNKSCGCRCSIKKDITGQRFGKLTALRPTGRTLRKSVVWECQCDCGRIVPVPTNQLTTGNTKSCGCSHYKDLDIAGQRYGKLTALRPTEQREKNSLIWECRCDCGKVILLSATVFTSKKFKSCGCSFSNTKDFTGQRFGMLIALRPTDEREHGAIVWECKCDCGKIVFRPSVDLTKGRFKSCGCTLYNAKDITGQRFGILTALHRSDQRIYGRVAWECKCDCGNTTTLPVASLTSGATKSCGCMKGKSNILEISGEKFGRLTALHILDQQKDGNYLWECLCDCGRTVLVPGTKLRKGEVKSCGCLHKDVCLENAVDYIKKYCIEGTNLLTLCRKPGKNNKSGTTGVFFATREQKWVAQIRFKGKTYYLGMYKKIEDAIAARMKAEEELHVKFLELHGREPYAGYWHRSRTNEAET